MARTIMDFINTTIRAEAIKANEKPITYEEWCDIRRNGTPDEIAEAVEAMAAAGGYENLQ